jgi:hypothetical protein
MYINMTYNKYVGGVGIMTLFEEFGGLQNHVNFKLSKDLLIEGIRKQRDIVSKGFHKDADPRTKSVWFKGNVFRPYIGLHLLFGKKIVKFRDGDEIRILDALQSAVLANDAELMGFLKVIDEARKKPRKPRTMGF